MSRCEEYIIQMNQYLDGELSQQESGDFLRHLESCPSCRKYFEQIKIATYELRHMKVSVPDTLHGSIMRHVRANSGAGRHRKLVRALSSLVACAAVLAIVATGGLNRVFLFGTGLKRSMSNESVPQTAVSSAPDTVDRNMPSANALVPPEAADPAPPPEESLEKGGLSVSIQGQNGEIPEWANDHALFLAPTLHNRTVPAQFIIVTGADEGKLATLFPNETLYQAEETGEWYLETANDEETVYNTAILLADNGYTIHDTVEGLPETDASTDIAVFVIFTD